MKLQKTLIQRNQATTPKDTTGLKPPTADELLTARLILHRLQDFPITAELLRKSKLHKVLRCIIKDPTLKYPESFKLHDRCQEVLDVWKEPIEQLKLENNWNMKIINLILLIIVMVMATVLMLLIARQFIIKMILKFLD